MPSGHLLRKDKRAFSQSVCHKPLLESVEPFIITIFFFFAKTISLLFGSTCLCQVTFSKVRFVKHINGPDPHVCIRIIFDFLFPKQPVDMGSILRRLKSNDQLCKMTPHYRWPVKPFFCDIQFVSCTKSVLFFECSCCIFQLKY